MATASGVKIAPSILAADFSRLGEAVEEAERGGADYVHLDVMDGRFVPTLTFGPQMVRALRRRTSLPLDVHAMVSDPESMVDELADCAPAFITVHVEAAAGRLPAIVQRIRAAGVSPGVAVSPATPVSAVEDVLPEVDMVLVMTVNPGRGGQPFIPAMLDKVRRVRALLDRGGLHAELEVDGGIGVETAGDAAAAGARVLVAGSAVYTTGRTVAESIADIRRAAERARSI